VVATADEPGKPTPEGIHCDGFDFVTFHVVDRVNVTGGENIVYAKDETPLLRRTLLDPWDSILADDSRVLHYTTEVRPCDGEVGHRDMLLMSYHCR
jgi:hypothetical protein